MSCDITTSHIYYEERANNDEKTTGPSFESLWAAVSESNFYESRICLSALVTSLSAPRIDLKKLM